MKSKSPDLAAGRLGTPFPAGQDPDDKAARKNHYGAQRLGIASETPEEPAAAAQGESPRRPEASAPQADTSAKTDVTVALREMLAKAPPPQAATRQGVYAPPAVASPALALWHRRKRVILAALGGAMAIGLVVLLWAGFSGNGTSPRSASAAVETPQRPPQRTPVGAGRDRQEPTADAGSEPAEDPAGQPASPRQLPPPGEPDPLGAAQAPPSPPAGPDAPTARPPSASAGAVRALLGSLRRLMKAAAESRPPPAPEPPEPPVATRPSAPARKAVSAFGVCPPGIVLSCIMRGPAGPVAIINNRTVKVGQTVNDAKVIRIEQFAVELELKGRRFMIGVASPSAPAAAPQAQPQPEPDKTPGESEGQQQEQDD